jgi:DNA-binding NarL/FixJ family response regulator
MSTKGIAGSGPVLLVDDHRLIATTLVASLRAEGLDASWHSAPGPELESALAESDPGLVLLDLDLGVDESGERIDGGGLVRGLTAAGWAVLILSGTTDTARLADAVAEGAIGWVGKDAPFELLLARCLAAARGEPVLDAVERRRLLADRHSQRRAESGERARLDRLTAREREILGELAAGVRVSEIAERSYVSVATVRSQVKAIRAKLEVGSQLEAAAFYRAHR